MQPIGCPRGVGECVNGRSPSNAPSPLLQRSLQIFEREYGAEHKATLRQMMVLGNAYSNTGAFAEAEPLLQRALAGCESTLGPEHFEHGGRAQQPLLTIAPTPSIPTCVAADSCCCRRMAHSTWYPWAHCVTSAVHT